MSYSIAQAAERCGLTAHTLRFYDREGLLPRVERTSGGTRVFKDDDLEALRIIRCLKDTGMPIKKIKRFIDLCMEGDAALEERLAIIRGHKEVVEAQMAALRKNMETLDYKLWYYETAVEAGTETIHRQPECLGA